MGGDVLAATLQQTIQGGIASLVHRRQSSGRHPWHLSQSALRAPSICRGTAERATPEPEGLVGSGLTILAAPRQTIVLEGDPSSHCFRAPTGTVCLYKGTIDGRRQLIDFLVAGDCFGLLGAR
jgi:hypothetical protein